MDSPSQKDASGLVPESTSAPSDETIPQRSQENLGSPAVRFASSTQEIEPERSLEPLSGIPSIQEPFAECDIRELSATLHNTQLQNRRMSHFAFEPVSLPASRVPSNEDTTSGEASRNNTNTSSGRQSPRQSPLSTSMQTPPLTPAATKSRDAEPLKGGPGAPLQPVEAHEDSVTPQISGGRSTPGTSRPTSSDHISTRPTSLSEEGRSGGSIHPKFSIGPARGHESLPVSREASPTRPSAYSRPFSPAGDVNDPYAANKRAPQSRNLDAIDPRFVFSGRGVRHKGSASSSSLNLPKSSRSATDIKEKRSSFFGGKKDPHLSHLKDDSASTLPKSGSMSELKRFLKLGGHHKAKRNASPAGSMKSGMKTPPTHNKTPQQLPFGEDHGLISKYGKFGKVLGAGAGGSVRVMKRSSDGTTFAVKEFRARHSYETEKEYNKKVTAEFCIGSTLHHGNIIETLDIIQEKGKWFEVMEYAPYDLFAIVMTGKMSREEVTCSFLQILSGVTYLHSMGLAHRDLKLDNVVVNEHGIMKIIDFGSSSVFKYPFESELVLASGIVGSDPYLAPEVYDERKYDPQPTDIWSLAIIFCCMSLRRFPWKMPRMTDNSYKLFASPPTPGTDIRRDGISKLTGEFVTDVREVGTKFIGKPISLPPKNSEPETPASKIPSPKDVAPEEVAPNEKPPAPSGSDGAASTTSWDTAQKKPEIIKGPWRLLRLLPRESRHIMGRMLEIDPKKRAKMDEILADPWVADTQICQQMEKGKINKAEGHIHTLEPPAAPAK